MSSYHLNPSSTIVPLVVVLRHRHQTHNILEQGTVGTVGDSDVGRVAAGDIHTNVGQVFKTVQRTFSCQQVDGSVAHGRSSIEGDTSIQTTQGASTDGTASRQNVGEAKGFCIKYNRSRKRNDWCEKCTKYKVSHLSTKNIISRFFNADDRHLIGHHGASVSFVVIVIEVPIDG